MRWSILVLTQPTRATFLWRLSNLLVPQLERFHRDVELVIKQSNPERSLGANRQLMVDEAKGEYVNFVDDDDLVSPDYAALIYPLLDGVDYVGFRVQTWLDREKAPMTYHSLRYQRWHEDQHGYYRDLSHINPIRRELARQARFEGGVGEDNRWANALRSLGLVKTEHFIDEVLYHYYYRSNKEPLNVTIQ